MLELTVQRQPATLLVEPIVFVTHLTVRLRTVLEKTVLLLTALLIQQKLLLVPAMLPNRRS